MKYTTRSGPALFGSHQPSVLFASGPSAKQKHVRQKCLDGLWFSAGEQNSNQHNKMQRQKAEAAGTAMIETCQTSPRSPNSRPPTPVKREIPARFGEVDKACRRNSLMSYQNTV